MLITLTTDFGVGSPYVGQMKGALLSVCRGAQLVDITHAIQPQNIREGAMVLGDAAPWFPAGTMHVAVIDPGVGTSRKLIYAEIGSQRFLAPDNGLLSRLTRAVPASRVFAVEEPRYWNGEVSSTFHGRDILAPVAGHLANGLDPAALGPALSKCVELDWPEPRFIDGRLQGEVVYVDSFGNLISNITREQLARHNRETVVVECAGRQMKGLQSAYGDSRPGDPVALLDSRGRLEIAVVNGSAGARLGVAAGETVWVY